jgi:transposase
VASRFLVPDGGQSFFEAVSYREVLGDDHPVWTVIGVVDELDLSEVYGRDVADVSVGGRPAFDPAMLLALLVFGYCEGKRSSRALEDACCRDWAYRAICGGMCPDHATIARFPQGLDDVLFMIKPRLN